MAYFNLYRDRAGEFRWTLRSSKNGNKIADSAEGYASKQGALAGINFVKTNAPGAIINDKT